MLLHVIYDFEISRCEGEIINIMSMYLSTIQSSATNAMLEAPPLICLLFVTPIIVSNAYLSIGFMF